MPSSRLIRAQIEAALAEKIPSALTPQPRVLRPAAATSIREIDELLQGGLPMGAISEITGAESSGRTSLALAFLAATTQAGKLCAWVDASNALHPESAAAIGVDLTRMLWVRCGVLPAENRRAPISTGKSSTNKSSTNKSRTGKLSARKPWFPLDQALCTTDLLLQAGGFSSIVLDMGSIAPEYASRVPLTTWFRFRAAAERMQLNLVLLTQHACSKNSAGLVLRLCEGVAITRESTFLAGMIHRAELASRRFIPPPGNVVPLRKPPQSVLNTQWHSRSTWTGRG
jgi:recombination protein RecA